MTVPLAALRGVSMVGALGLWFWTQRLIGRRSGAPGAVGDQVHVWTESWNAALARNPKAADALLIASSLGIDLLGATTILYSIFGPSVRPLIALLIIFSLRQLCQATTSLPPPKGMIWRDPGVPSFLVTYGVSNDLFFSGHTAIAVLGALVLHSLGYVWLDGVVLLVAAFEIAAVLVLRAHYTLDVFTGAVVALWVWSASQPAALWVDGAFSRLIKG
ncbi:MAG: phosphatase PAP2-related protein [Elusimicrobia bacterium]|nr:phosphatase PAP2-related protein [Elusimicrobiota bacterium]